MSADSEQEYFCDGLTEELINTLSKIRDLKVVARTSAFAFKGGGLDVRKAGRKLEVSTVLEGSVRKAGNQLRITAQLINVADGYHLWSETYDREVQDVFKIQDEISLAIVDVLKVKLFGEEKEKFLKRYTDNIEAYNLYLQGYYFFNTLDLSMLRKAREYFRQALEKDPNFAIAYSGLGAAYFAPAYFGAQRSSDIKAAMLECIQKGLEIDPNLSEMYNTLGLYTGCLEWKFPEAQAAWQRSIELNPGNAIALLYYSINRSTFKDYDLARELVKRAQNIDPLHDVGEFCAALPDYATGQFARVADRLSKYLSLDPPFWWGLWTLWRAFSLMGKKAEAVDACKKSYAITGREAIVQVMDRAGTDNAFHAAACALADYYQHQYTSPLDIATLFLHAGKEEEAFPWLGKALDDVDPRLHLLNVDPDWHPYRNDPRFQRYLKRIGLIP